MNKAEKKFVWYAALAIFVSVTVLLGIINLVTFSMAAKDADRVTEMIAEGRGRLLQEEQPGEPLEMMPGEQFEMMPGMPEGQPGAGTETLPGNEEGQSGRRPGRGQGDSFGGFGPMGPTSPEMNESLRYFTCEISKDGSTSLTAFHISAVSEEEALNWAVSLSGGSTGWTRGTYRYRVYKNGGSTYVTVADQGREMISCYRILIISLIGDAVAVLLGFLILRLIGRKLFKPLEEADRKEKQFLKAVEQEFKVPLTVISANTELLDRANGPAEETAVIRQEVKRMTELVSGISTYTLFEEAESAPELSALLVSIAKEAEGRFTAAGKSLTTDIQPGIRSEADPVLVRKVVEELLANMLKYGPDGGKLSLVRSGERIHIVAENATDLPDGLKDRAFDRNTVLENGQGLGAGLANVKEAVGELNGRIRAEVKDGVFTVTVSL